MKKQTPKSKNWIQYYDDRNILDEITDDYIDLVLDEHLRDEILSGKRKRKLKNITIKVDPLQVKAIKKLSTMEVYSLPNAYSILARRGYQIGDGFGTKIESSYFSIYTKNRPVFRT